MQFKLTTTHLLLGAMLAFTTLSMNSCSDDDSSPTPAGGQNPVGDTTDRTPTPSKLKLLTGKNWKLYEALADNVVVTSNGEDLYDFTKDGLYLRKRPSETDWFNRGVYVWHEDSTAIDLTFTSVPYPATTLLKRLDEEELHIEFTLGGSTFFYKHKAE